MDAKNTLDTIWSSEYIQQLPEFVKERGYVYAINEIQRDILITGINPSYRGDGEYLTFGFDFQQTLNEKYDNYWGPLKKMVYDPENSIDLKEKSAYLDIFYFREQNQNLLKKQILKSEAGIRFLVEQLKLTQHTIEEYIQPKLIIIKNKESAAYWGKYASDGMIWMGYNFEFIETSNFGELYKIKGLIESQERIAPEIKETNLKDTLVLFTKHINQYTKKENRPTAVFINELLGRVKR